MPLSYLTVPAYAPRVPRTSGSTPDALLVWMPACKLLGAALLVASLLVDAGASGAPPPAPFCPGVYADDLRTLSGDARTFDRGPEAVFSYCARNTAHYA